MAKRKGWQDKVIETRFNSEEDVDIQKAIESMNKSLQEGNILPKEYEDDVMYANTETETHACPNCKSNKTKDYSLRQDNGVMGPGYTSWKLMEVYVCLECGVLFVPLEKLK